MKRNLLILISLLGVGSGWAAEAQDTNAIPAQETNSTPALDWSYFEPMTHKNIFDTTRTGPYVPGSRPITHVPVRLAFTFAGDDELAAFFTGEGVGPRGFFKVGDTLNGFKVMQITLHTVKLLDPSGAIVVLKTGESMRREDEGPWTKTDELIPVVLNTTSTRSDSAPASASSSSAPSGGGESDVLKRLRMKREQEEK